MNQLDQTLGGVQEHWACLAFSFSLFFGLRGAYLTWRGNLKEDHVNFGKAENHIAFRWLRFLLWAAYNFIFQFVGSMAGWVCLYLLIARIRVPGSTQPSFTGQDFGLFAFAILGITGNISSVLMGAMVSLDNFVQNVIRKVAPPHAGG